MPTATPTTAHSDIGARNGSNTRVLHRVLRGGSKRLHSKSDKRCKCLPCFELCKQPLSSLFLSTPFSLTYSLANTNSHSHTHTHSHTRSCLTTSPLLYFLGSWPLHSRHFLRRAMVSDHRMLPDSIANIVMACLTVIGVPTARDRCAHACVCLCVCVFAAFEEVGK